MKFDDDDYIIIIIIIIIIIKAEQFNCFQSNLVMLKIKSELKIFRDLFSQTLISFVSKY